MSCLPTNASAAAAVVCAFFVAASAVQECNAALMVRGAHYRLGDDDPGAAPGAFGNTLTRDSLGDDEPLSRYGMPRYSADVPPAGPAGNRLSMEFHNQMVAGPPFPAAYGRAESLPMSEPGYSLEAWVKPEPVLREDLRNSIVAYNGDPDAGNGFGFFLRGGNYVLQAGNFERVLGPAEIGRWHHLAYVRSMGTSSYFYDGRLVAESTTDPAPAAASGGFHLAGLLKGQLIDVPPYEFDGWIDEVRYQAFNPMAAGAFEPTSFLISAAVPEPTAPVLAAAVLAPALLRRRPRRR